jgi:N-acyl-D-amino-acid deacylase
MTIFQHPTSENMVRLGITTEFTGNCGTSAHAPSEEMTVRQYFDKVDEQGLNNNHAMFVGQGTVRRLVLGKQKRFSTPEEIEKMRSLVLTAMREGCIGMSSGRAYIPGCFATTRECTELAKIVAEFEGLYTFHIQNQNEFIHQATQEVIDIGRRANIRVLIAHQKVVGKNNWGRAPEILAMMEKAVDRGIDLLSDVYPYTYSAVMMLGRILPKEITDVSTNEAAARLKDPNVLAKIKDSVAKLPAEAAYVLSLLPQYGVVYCGKTKEYEWMDLQEVADAKDMDLYEAILDLLAENELNVKIAGIMSEEDVQTFIKHPLSMIGTDAMSHDPEHDRKMGDAGVAGGVHPRAYGTHARVLGRYVRELGLLNLETAVKKMTSQPALHARIYDRGLVRRNLNADLVVFDPLTVGETTTLDNPVSFPTGIPYVIVNGKMVVDKSDFLDSRPGKVYRDPQGRWLYGAGGQ